MSISEKIINNEDVHLFTDFHSSSTPPPYSLKQRKCTDEEDWFCSSRGFPQLLWGPPISLRYPEHKYSEQGPE